MIDLKKSILLLFLGIAAVYSFLSGDYVDIKDSLTTHFQKSAATPFLFIGSGFSRRYLGLENWEGLLARFCTDIRPFDYYLTSANGDLATTASLMATDFHEIWWTKPQYEASREKYKGKVKDKTSALRIEIANYLHALSLHELMATEHKDEIELLSQLNVDGIITTNWDLLLETLFPDYKVFVGQGEMLFSNPQSIAEIYKIHGSASRPASLVLTKEDYIDFDNKNPYLAAKLITLFVEHPIVFIGYSLTDKNMCSLLRSIVAVLGTENIKKLQNNLIFIERTKEGEEPSYNQTYMTIDRGQLPITIVKARSYVPVYEALDTVKRKIPARVLRLCKEQLYEIVRSANPDTKICVVDLDKIQSKEDVQFIVGVGVAKEHENSNAPVPGYQPISIPDLCSDVLAKESKFDPARILGWTVPLLGKSATYVPVYRYLRACGIDSAETYAASPYKVDKHILPNPYGYATNMYARQFITYAKDKDAVTIISSNPPEKAAAFLAFLPKDKFDLTAIGNFLSEHIEKLDSYSNYSTYFRKLACLYDRYAYGWETEPAGKKERAHKVKSTTVA